MPHKFQLYFIVKCFFVIGNFSTKKWHQFPFLLKKVCSSKSFVKMSNWMVGRRVDNSECSTCTLKSLYLECVKLRIAVKNNLLVFRLQINCNKPNSVFPPCFTVLLFTLNTFFFNNYFDIVGSSNLFIFESFN